MPTVKKLAVIIILLQLSSFYSFGQFNKIFDFGVSPNGIAPHATPVFVGAYLYGTTLDGGVSGAGTVYKVKPDGTGYSHVYDFDGAIGAGSYASLFYDGTSLYGTSVNSGSDGHGTIYKLNPDGTGAVKLHEFSFTVDGAFPYAPLISDGTYLYGSTTQGGPSQAGTIFKILKDGSGFTTIFSFDGTTAGSGSSPYGGLFYDGTFLYGTTFGGGYTNLENIFKIKPDGTGYSKMQDFNGAGNGQAPFGALVSDGTYLYGTTSSGGSHNDGTLFKIKSDGTNFQTLVNFTNDAIGSLPLSSVVSDGTYLYGTTTDFGANSRGTIYKIKTDGSGLTKLADNDIPRDGPYPIGDLLLSGSTLYTTFSGIGHDFAPFLPGSVLSVNTDGTNFSYILSFDIVSSSPQASLYSDGTYHYGTTFAGGHLNVGTIFKIKPDGTGFASIKDFADGADGARPSGSLTSDGTFLYGTTDIGGVNDAGTIFKLKPDGSGYVKIADFNPSTTGNNSNGKLYFDGSFLYGLASNSGAHSAGTIFRLAPDGTGFVSILDFDGLAGGLAPSGSLISDGTFLYGTTTYGGNSNSSGILFKIKPDGSGFTKLMDFDSDNTGSNPTGALFSDGTFLYGTTTNGGAQSSGTLYKIKPDGTGYVKLVDFDNNISGSLPTGSLVSDGSYLYGMTQGGGVGAGGTIFKVKTDGSGFLKLKDLTDGTNPTGALLLENSNLYGLTSSGGDDGFGIYFGSTTTAYASISRLVPSSGVVGTYVTIYGTDFDLVPANNIVKFNSVSAVVRKSTATTLSVIVPVGATTGPVSITANGTSTGNDMPTFLVVDETPIVNDTVQSCNTKFSQPGGDDSVTETFVPVNSSDKIKLSFSSFNVTDEINVYDGPDTSSPLLVTLSGTTIPPDVIATGPTGQLTVAYVWEDSGASWEASITCQSAQGATITITPQALATQAGGKIVLDLVPLITTTSNNLDLKSLRIAEPPPSGASATIDSKGILTIDYSGISSFTGTENITIGACDLNDYCATQVFTITVAEATGELIVYQGISPNGDGANDSWFVKNITGTETASNHVTVFNRWGDSVFEVDNYDNAGKMFDGHNKSGGELPNGIYFYRITFASGKSGLSGYLSLKRVK